MEPLPIPTLRPSTPASIRFFAWAAVTTAADRGNHRDICSQYAVLNIGNATNLFTSFVMMPSKLFGQLTAEIHCESFPLLRLVLYFHANNLNLWSPRRDIGGKRKTDCKISQKVLFTFKAVCLWVSMGHMLASPPSNTIAGALIWLHRVCVNSCLIQLLWFSDLAETLQSDCNPPSDTSGLVAGECGAQSSTMQQVVCTIRGHSSSCIAQRLRCAPLTWGTRVQVSVWVGPFSLNNLGSVVFGEDNW